MTWAIILGLLEAALAFGKTHIGAVLVLIPLLLLLPAIYLPEASQRATFVVGVGVFSALSGFVGAKNGV